MTWFAFHGLNGGKAIDLAGTQEKQAVAEGFHGYATQALAEKNPNAVNFVTRQFADLFIADYNGAGPLPGAVQEQAQPGGKNANILNPATAAKAGATGDVKEVENATGITSVTQFLSTLTSENLWIRVAKVAVGSAMILIGLAKLTGVDNTVSDAAKKMPLIL